MPSRRACHRTRPALLWALALGALTNCVCETNEGTIDTPCTRALWAIEQGTARPEDVVLTGPLSPASTGLGESVHGGLYLCNVSAAGTSSVVRFEGLREIRDGLYLEGTEPPVHFVFPALERPGYVSHHPRFPAESDPSGLSLGRILELSAYVGTSSDAASIIALGTQVRLPRAQSVRSLETSSPMVGIIAPRLEEADTIFLRGSDPEASPEVVGLPALRRASRVHIDFWPLAEVVRFERLEEVGDLALRRSEHLRVLDFPELRAIRNVLTIENTPSLSPCEVKRLLDQLEVRPTVIDSDLPLDGVECP